jgi:agmatinase
MQPEVINFFNLPAPQAAEADVLLLPWPLEQTVSYNTGTRSGPQAILNASPQIELYEEETGVDFTQGPKILTLPAISDRSVTPESLEEHLSAVAEQISLLRQTHPGKFLLTLGGEHSLTYGAVLGLVDDPQNLTIVQIDAHADLADKLLGRHWSHGTVMRRLWEHGCRFVQIGIRSLSLSEFKLVSQVERIETYFAHSLRDNWPRLLDRLANLHGKVYLTFDVDGLDPSIVPGTGTPQPNGLSWLQAMEVIRAVAAADCQWIGADVVETIGLPQLPASDFAVARLVSKIVAFRATKGKSL